MMRKLKIVLSVIFITWLLSGCYNKGELKTLIQDEYDRMRALKNAGDFCFYLGRVKFPYNEIPINRDDNQGTIWNKEDLANTLPLFFELGLLEREPISANPVLYRYQLTQEGEKYQYLHPFGRVDNNNAFCYGKRVILAVTDVSERVVGDGVGNATQKQTIVNIRFNYKITNFPEWAGADVLYKIYGEQFHFKGENDVSNGSVNLLKRADGLYNGAIGGIAQVMRKPIDN